MPRRPFSTRLMRLLKDRRGSAMVEAALVLPLVMTLTFGLIEMGRALHHHHVLSKSVRDAARYLARVPLGCPATVDANWATASATAKTLALTGRMNGTTPLVSYWTTGAFTIAPPTCQTIMGREVQVMAVTGAVNYQSLGFLNLINLPSFQLRASHREMHIGE
ncbi:TadE/TadG family type IV pilus assembly protein [Azospirillum soli]|uniref:TadE/TadG family type IV pilus assembly protein n=1 Tax=Azospirillum soli TaxID=1304799 RepID=UPI001AE82878|nr:TadE/TadG family type IV pilus assembly protein [Azospirillum soli]MBP2316724.1 Flp pilus assembly protein TadG [Azospirillum soli]